MPIGYRSGDAEMRSQEAKAASKRWMLVSTDTLRTLKEAAWLWSCESVGNYRDIKKACHEAAMILEEAE